MYQSTNHNWTAAKWSLFLAVSVMVLAGCGVFGGETDPALVSDDQELARQLLDGWPAPPDMYEVQNLTCEKLDDRISATATITNNNDFPWPFGVEMVFIASNGEVFTQRTDPGFWEPGQTIDINQWIGGPEDFDDEPSCEVNIYHGVDLAFRKTELKAQTYERLGWDPFTETRTDGS